MLKIFQESSQKKWSEGNETGTRWTIVEDINGTVISLLKEISEKLNDISEYIEFKKREELYRREMYKYCPRGKLLLEEKEGFENRIRVSREPK